MHGIWYLKETDRERAELQCSFANLCLFLQSRREACGLGLYLALSFWVVFLQNADGFWASFHSVRPSVPCWPWVLVARGLSCIPPHPRPTPRALVGYKFHMNFLKFRWSFLLGFWNLLPFPTADFWCYVLFNFLLLENEVFLCGRKIFSEKDTHTHTTHSHRIMWYFC